MNEVGFQIFSDGTGMVALDTNGNCGYGDTPEECLKDLALAYSDNELIVYDIELTKV